MLVESAMLAALSGVGGVVLGLLRLESYMLYILPFPIVLAYLKSGYEAGRQTVTAAFFLLLGIFI